MKTQDDGGNLPDPAILRPPRLEGVKAPDWKFLQAGYASPAGSSELSHATKAICVPVGDRLGVPERKLLLAIARETIANAVAQICPPEVKEIAPLLSEQKACFVTLTKEGALRGCVGHLFPRLPLYQAVMECARNAAMRDARFPPVQSSEVNSLIIEISVLTEPVALVFGSPEELLGQLRPFEHGVLLHVGPRLATFLPSVWTQIPDKVKFLDRLAEKAGCPAASWRDQEATVSVYYTECFEEPGRLASAT